MQAFETATLQNAPQASQGLKIATLALNSFIIQEKEEIEKRLRKCLEESGAEYRSTTDKCRRLTALHHDLGFTHPDGRTALEQAVKAQTGSLRKYRVALQDFNDFVLHGKLPSKLG